MPVQLGVKASPDFNDPLGLLSDCHRRIENFLSVLLKVAQSNTDGTLAPGHREALEGALRYFRVAAPKHTHDEEDSLFPRLRDCPTSEAREALAKVEALEADHARADEAHAQVDALGSRWLAEGTLPEIDRQRMAQLLQELRALYQHHIEIEDREVFPLAGRVLSQEQLASVGREMAERRQIGKPSERGG